MLQYATPETLTTKRAKVTIAATSPWDASIRNIKDKNKGVTRKSLAVSSIQVAFGDKNQTLLADWYFRKTDVTH